jgi:hypothetical protein
MCINDIWHSNDPIVWEQALNRYEGFVRKENIELERSLGALSLERIKNFNSQDWYDFLQNEYFRWKYTAKNRYASTTKQLKRYINDNALDVLDNVRQRLLLLNPKETLLGLNIAKEIRGLGTAGASGLLSLMYPEHFATVDQFVVKALRQVKNLPQANEINEMQPESLTVRNGVLLIGILAEKAKDNNLKLKTSNWTPRKIDMLLWTFGR